MNEQNPAPAETSKKKRNYTKLPELDLAGAQLSLVSPAVVDDRRKTRAAKERSKPQLALDALVAKAYEKWVSQGKPADFGERPGGHVVVKEAQYLTVKRALSNSGAYLGMSVRFCDDVFVNGNVDIVFTATDRTERKPRKDSAK